jgi:hypothetical protein
VRRVSGSRLIRLAAAACVSVALLPTACLAQAWLPEKGDFSLGLNYVNALSKKHYLPDGSEIDVGHTRVQTVALSASYALSDRINLMASLPWVQTRYAGDHPHPGEIDNGHSHSTITDLYLSAHYQLALEPVAIAPYVAAVIPTHDYETLGHAAPGRGLNEYWIGFYGGKSLHQWIPQTYIQVSYNYAVVERVAGISHDRSNADLEVGHFLNRRVSIRALVAWQKTHGGIDVPIPPSDPLFPYHDQLGAEGHLNVGAGLSWAANSQLGVDISYLQSIRGENGHKLDPGISLGISYSPARR